MSEPTKARIARPVMFWVWMTIVVSLGLAVVLLPIFAVP
jgi:hypothetical protein